jgi:hypothetical protein
MAAITKVLPPHTPALASNVQEDTEKNTIAEQETRQIPIYESQNMESNRELKQDGVKRMAALTAVWTKQILILMFVLYVLNAITISWGFTSRVRC